VSLFEKRNTVLPSIYPTIEKAGWKSLFLEVKVIFLASFCATVALNRKLQYGLKEGDRVGHC